MAAGYLRLTDDEWVIKALRVIPGMDQMAAHPIKTVSRLRSADIALSTSFAVSGLGEGGPGGLSSVVPIEAVHWPPLLILCRRSLPGWEQEHLRRQGVSAIVDISEGAGQARRIVDALARSSEWFGANLTRAPLADLLQMLAADGRSGMIWVGCSHNRALSPHRWENGGAFCGGNSNACGGWAARLHLHAGNLVYAETPTLLGLEAFSKCLSLSEGYLRVHEVYMAPGRANLEGTVQQLLISAAALADEMARDRHLTSRGRPPGMVTRRRPAAPRATAGHASVSTQPQLSADLEPSVPASAPPPARGAAASARPSASPTVPPPLPRTAKPEPAPAASVRGASRSEPRPLKEVLGGEAQVRLALTIDAAGKVVAAEGGPDADNVADVATMCSVAFDKVGARLGLGDATGWCTVGSAQAVYAERRDDGLRVAVGAGSENALRHLGRLFTKVRP